MIKDSHVIVLEDTLVQVFDDDEKYLENLGGFDTKVDKIFTLILNTIDNKIKQIVKSKKDPYDAFCYLRAKYKRELHIELKQCKKKLRTIRCPSLEEYLHSFELVLAEFEMLSGNRKTSEVFEAFIDGISDEKYSTYKCLYNGTDIDDALEYFRKIAEREEDKPNGKKLQAKKFNVDGDARNLPFKKVRCKTCSGVGHTSEQCPSPTGLCHLCCEQGHSRRKCPNKKKTGLRMKKAVMGMFPKNTLVTTSLRLKKMTLIVKIKKKFKSKLFKYKKWMRWKLFT